MVQFLGIRLRRLPSGLASQVRFARRAPKIGGEWNRPGIPYLLIEGAVRNDGRVAEAVTVTLNPRNGGYKIDAPSLDKATARTRSVWEIGKRPNRDLPASPAIET